MNPKFLTKNSSCLRNQKLLSLFSIWKWKKFLLPEINSLPNGQGKYYLCWLQIGVAELKLEKAITFKKHQVKTGEKKNVIWVFKTTPKKKNYQYFHGWVAQRLLSFNICRTRFFQKHNIMKKRFEMKTKNWNVNELFFWWMLKKWKKYKHQASIQNG